MANALFDQASLANILAGAPDPIVITDEGSLIIYANRAALNFFADEVAALIGASAVRLFPQWFGLPVPCRNFTTVASLADGTLHPIRLSFSPAQTKLFVAGVTIFRSASVESDDAARMGLQERELRALVQHQTDNLAKIQTELDDAARILERHLPSPHLEGLDVSWIFQPSQTLGGDILLVHRYKERVILGMLDVSGHGVAASLLAIGLARGLSPGQGGHVVGRGGKLREPKDVVTRLNRESRSLRESGLFATLVFGILDLTSREFSFSCAGHPRPIRVWNGKAREIEGHIDPPLGLDAAARYRQSKVTLRPGELLVVYTDGVTESRSSSGDFFGEDRLLSFLAGIKPNESGVANKLGLELTRFRNARAVSDDVSLIAIRAP